MSEADTSQRKKAMMWEQLKKDARRLEGEVEVKLSQYSRMGAGTESGPVPGDSIRSLQGASQVQADIDSLLAKLQEVHNSMEADVSGSDIRHHTVTRHREILQDFSQEFRRMSVQISQAKSRAELLAGAREMAPLMDVSVDSTAGSLVRERNHLQASTAAIDGVLGQAGHVASSLKDQGGMFDNIGNKLATAGAKFPVINSLMSAIRRRKSKDTIVISAVVTVCTLFLFWYVLHKWF